MSKRVKGIFLILMLVLMLLGSNAAFAAVVDEVITIHAYTTDKDSIYAGDPFELYINLKTSAPTRTITGINLVFGTDMDFQMVDGAGNIVSAYTDLSRTNKINMRYTGGNDIDIPVSITYTFADGDTGTTAVRLLRINQAKSSIVSPPKDPTADPSQYMPELELGFSEIPEGMAGASFSIPLVLNNPSIYEAKSIKIEPLLEGTPLIIDQQVHYKTMGKMEPKKSAVFDFRFNIQKDAKADTYKIPFQISYTDTYGNKHDAYTEIIYINITNDSLPVQLVVLDAASNPKEVRPDEDFTIAFNVWNMGTYTAENVTVDLEPGENFYILDNISKLYLFEMKGLSNEGITYTLRPKKDLKSGTYGVTVFLQHKELAAPEKYTIYVNVAGTEEDEDDVDIITENIVTPQAKVLTEQPFTVSLDITNIGATDAENVKITVDSGEKILPQSLNVLSIPKIKAGESMPVSFSFKASQDCESRSYPIKVLIEYENNEKDVKKEQYMGVLIEKKEDTKASLNTIPKIIISEYSTDPGMVNAGEKFTLYMNFLNTNKVKAVQNMKITLVVDQSEKSEETGSVFTPVQSSNTFYIDYLEPGQSSSKEMVMYTIPDAKAKTYVVKAMFEYEYEEQDQIKQSNMEDVFGIPVVQPAKFETTEVVVQEPAFVGEPVYLSAEFYNMGKVTLSNLMVKAEGDFDNKESNYFVGNFGMGNSDFYEAPITPLTAGELKGKLVFTFEDSSGTEHRVEKEFTVNVMEAAPVMNMGEFPTDGMGMGEMDPGMMGPQTSKFPWIPVGIGAAVVILAVVLLIIRKRRKKRKEMMLDEDI